MKFKIIGFLVSFFFCPLFLSAAPEILWTQTYQSSPVNYGCAVQQTTDGGFIIVGYKGDGCWFSGFQSWLIKTDASGNTIWTQSYPGFEFGQDVQHTTNDGYILAGYTVYDSTGSGDTNGWLIKTDANGDTLWTRLYGGSGCDIIRSVHQTTDGGYILAGSTTSFGNDQKDGWLIKTDTFGDTLWTRTYGGVESDYGKAVQQTNDGGYVLVGTTSSFGAGDTDFWLIKTDANGDTLWTRTYGGALSEYGRSVWQTSDGGYILAGTTTSFGVGNEDYWLVKTDANGDTLWAKTYGSLHVEDAYAVQQTADSGYIITGATLSLATDQQDCWIIKTDTNGDTVWTQRFNAGRNEVGRAVLQISDGGYILIGDSHTIAGDEPGGPCWLLKIGESTSIQNVEQQIPNTFTLLPNFPNPFNPVTTIQYALPVEATTHLTIYNTNGRAVWHNTPSVQSVGWHQIQWNGTDDSGRQVATGVYFYQLRAGGYLDVKKMIFMK